MENMIFKRKLPIPMDIKADYPLSKEAENIKKQNDIEIKNILDGTDKRKLLIIGPCSADSIDSVLEYAHKLRALSETVKDRFKIVLRCFTAKPRTISNGYLGLIHQPDPSGNKDMLNGLIIVRKLFIKIIEETGLAIADEMLYPENHRYFSDCLSYCTIGARSSLDQFHRLTASGLSIPVGIKNSLSGPMSLICDSIISVNTKAMFLYRGWEVETLGNKYAHAVMRGYIDNNGLVHDNYHKEDIIKLIAIMDEYSLKYKNIIIDCNHMNSNKDYLKQIEIAKYVINLCNNDELINNAVKGLMIESYLFDGCQNIGDSKEGVSYTDSCLGFNKTSVLIEDLYKMYKW